MKPRKLSFADFAENELTRKQKTYIAGGAPVLPPPPPGEPLPGQPTGDIRDPSDNEEYVKAVTAVCTIP